MGAMETMNAGNLHFHEKHLQWYALLEGAHPTYNTLDLVYKNIAIPEWAAIYQFAPYEALAKVSPVLVKLDQPRKWLQQWQQSFPGLAGSMLGSGSMVGSGSYDSTMAVFAAEEAAAAVAAVELDSLDLHDARIETDESL